MTPRIFLDFGAFTSARQGEVIEVDDYIRFVRNHPDLLAHVVNLDVIPDRGMDRDQIEFACAQSYTNQQQMKDAGLNPLPVIHQIDRPNWLARYLGDGEPYLALAPKGRGSFPWLTECFRLITQASHSPKVHGLAVTNTLQLTKFPWTSVDSSTWIKQPAVGRVLVPLFDGDD